MTVSAKLPERESDTSSALSIGAAIGSAIESGTERKMKMPLIDSGPIEEFIQNGLNSGKFGHDAIEILTEVHYAPEAVVRCKELKTTYEGIPADRLRALAEADRDGRCVVLPKTGIGDLSDGYHTFNELYHHRAILFSVICNEHTDIAWKSKLHHDGTMYDGMFIVGINAPDGQATYHYDICPYWDMFQVKELDRAPEWDGHTPAQAIERIGNLTRPEAICKAERDGRCVVLPNPLTATDVEAINW